MKAGFVRSVLCWVIFCVPSPSQTYLGRILGTVTDQTGAVVAAAPVAITQIETGITRSVATNDVGEYVAPNLPPGTYRITVAAQGFKKVENAGLRLEVAKDVRVDFHLVPGQVSEAVTVTSEAALVETTNDTLGGTFSNKAVNDLPLNGRDFQNLVVLRPGVQRFPGGGFLSISSNGNRPEDNNFIVDGTDDNDPYYATTVINAEGVQGTPATHLPVDAIQEFNAEENPPAEYGWKPGAVINVGLKSGTNDFHGSTYYFHRNNAFDARNWFNKEPDPQKALRLHQFGFTAGGPIIRSKTFIFGAYEGARDLVGNSEIVNTPATVPIVATPATSTCVATVGDCVNSIPDAMADLAARGIPINPVTANLIGLGSFSGNGAFPGLFPANNGTTDPTNPAALRIGFPNKNREDDFIVKLDHQITSNQNLSGRYFFGDSVQIERDISVLRPQFQSTATTRAQVIGVNWTWSGKSAWVNEAKFGFNRFWQTILTVDHDKDPAATYGIDTGVKSPINFGMPEIAIGPFTSLGGNHGWPLLTTPNQTFQFADNVSGTKSKHAVRFGGEFRHGSTNNVRDRYGKGRIQFRDGDDAAGVNTALEDFLAGIPHRGRIFVGNSQRHASIKSFGAFIQDDWRATPKLTVNLGLRYDLTTVIKERNNQLGNFDPVKGIEQVGLNIDSPYDGDHNNFAPRIGVAWDPTGRGNTVIRAGGSVIYEIPHLSIFMGQNGVNNASTAGLNVIPTGAQNSATGATTLIPGGTIVANATNTTALDFSGTGPIFNTTVDCGNSPCDILGVKRDLRTPYVFSWNLNIQQALGRHTSLQTGYVGTKGVKLYSVYDINQVDPNSPAENSATCDHCEQNGRPFFSRFPFLEFINFLGNGYTSSYNGLQTTLTQRGFHGLSFVAGYTWAHSIDDASFNRAAQPQNSFRPDLERASGDNDIRHRFTLAMSYDLPSRTSWGQLLEGWQINSIVTFQTGTPWGMTDGFSNGNDISRTGEFSDRWNAIGDLSQITWSNTGAVLPCTLDPDPVRAAFISANFTDCQRYGNVLSIPDPGTFGNIGRNTFRGPGYHNWDFSVVKRWKLRESVTLQLRGEFFNVLNHPNFTNPNGVGGQLGNVDPSVPETFGFSSATPDVAAANPVIGSGGPRNIQVAVKLTF